MSKAMTESEVQDMCLDMLKELGYAAVYDPAISEDGGLILDYISVDEELKKSPTRIYSE